MFKNIGDKIKTLAEVICILGIISSFVIGCILMAIDLDFFLKGILTIVLGSLASWIGSFVLYGFGQLVDDVNFLRFNAENKAIEEFERYIRKEQQENSNHTNNFFINTPQQNNYNTKTTDDIIAKMIANKINTLKQMRNEGKISEEEYIKMMQDLKR